ncbi:peptidoglycan DD-metalloendopeptidase family protein [Clostridium sp. C8-1-8]|uniref:murein hydrolase activator EnvC family protein n=1 Tax=Clostridium sp. C8-1-8 TaxID=2698831 RepID=UPI0024335344|nr:peptidoglycan DD-metalloendopeptidase family protein [Clostridium sp. C8-1-8]
MNKKRLSIILAGLVIFSNISMVSIKASSKTQSEIQEEIKSNNEKIEDLQKNKDTIQSKENQEQDNLKKVREELYDKNTQLNNVQAEINKLKNEMNSLQGSIDELTTNIDNIKGEIIDKQAELVQKKDILGRRLRGMYKANFTNNMIDVLLDSNSLGDFISRFSSMTRIIKLDNNLINEVAEIQKQLEQKESKLNTQKEDIEAKKASVEVAKKSYNDSLAVYQSEVDSLRKLENERLAVIQSLTDEKKAIQNEISRYEEDTEDLKDYFNNTSSSNEQTTSTDGFISPAPGGITSSFGPRIHPITGKNSVHTGVDLGAGYGVPFKASKSGVVTTATYNKAYGNMVIIDHGNGVTTLYAHASKLNVSAGQRVNQGDIISYIGSTGYSTGPHAHFEIRINGQPVNPMKYLD